MEKPSDKKQNTPLSPIAELKEWESPQLFVENMETITEAGGFPVSKGDDGFYIS